MTTRGRPASSDRDPVRLWAGATVRTKDPMPTPHHRSSSRRPSLWLALALAAGCGKDAAPGRADDQAARRVAEPVAKVATAATPAPPAAATPAAAPITRAEADEFGQAFTKAMSGCDGGGIDALLDRPAFAERTRAAGLAAAKVSNTALGPSVCAGLGDDYKVRYVGAVEVAGALRPRIRTVVRGGVNFLEPVLHRASDASIKAIDLFSFRNGQMFSEVLSLVGKFLAHPQGEAGGRAFVAATQHHGRGEYAKARAEFLKIPADLRTKVKAIALQGLTIDVQQPPAIYLASIDAFNQNFPGDPAIKLVEIDAYALREEHPKLLASLSSLLEVSGGDAYVRVMRGTAHRTAGDRAAARADAEAAIAAEPDLADAHELLLEIAIDEKQYGEAVTALRAIAAGGMGKPDSTSS